MSALRYTHHNIGKDSSVSKASQTTRRNTESSREGMRKKNRARARKMIYVRTKLKRGGGIWGQHINRPKKEHMGEIQLNPQGKRAKQSYDN